jgi:hypothetical protein
MSSRKPASGRQNPRPLGTPTGTGSGPLSPPPKPPVEKVHHTVRLPVDLKRDLKIRAATLGETEEELTVRAIRNLLTANQD